MPAPRSLSSAKGNALVTFLVTALVLVTALAVLLRHRPELFGKSAQAAPFELPSPAPEPTGPLARYMPRPTTAALALRADEEVAVTIFRAAAPSVCLVSNLLRTPREGETPTATEHAQGTGSGIVWDSHGHIVTNYHVVEGANAATVTLADGSVCEAWLVGYDERYDLAVMRIDRPAESLVPPRFGRSSELAVGQRVFSIGFPYALGHTLASGLISGLARTIRTPKQLVLEGVVQTDADLHPGSSGGPLLDASGRVIGVAVAVHGEARHGGGLAFALPIDRVQEVVPEIMRNGFEWFPRLGLVLASDSQSVELLRALRAVGGASAAEWLRSVPEQGVLIAIVQEGSPAARAGLRGMLQGQRADGRQEYTVRDIVIGVDGAPVTGRDQLDAALFGAIPGQSFALRVAGASGERSVELVAE